MIAPRIDAYAVEQLIRELEQAQRIAEWHLIRMARAVAIIAANPLWKQQADLSMKVPLP